MRQVRGVAVLPATAYAELARRAATAAGRADLQIRDLQLLETRSVPDDGPVLLQTVASPDAAGSWSLRVYGRRPDEANWTVHAQGRLEAGASDDEVAGRPQPDNPAGLVEVDVQELYAALARSGLAYGPAFRRLERLWSDGRQALGRVGAADGTEGFVTLLDACLHTCAALVRATKPGRAWVPASCGTIVYHRDTVPDRAVVHATTTERSDRAIVIDVAITDDAGHPVAKFRRLRLRQLAGDGAPDAVWTYRIDWETMPPPVSASMADPAAPWLIIGGGGGTGAAILDAFDAAGLPTQVLDVLAADVGRDALRARLAGVRPAAGWRGILVPVDHDGVEATEDVVLGAVHLLGALGTGLDAPPPVWFVTTGSLAAAPLAGIARVVPLELPDVDCRVIDVGDAPPSVVGEQLVREIAAEGHDGWVVWRGGTRSVARLVAAPLPPRRDAPVAGTALVTGAFGGLGSVLVRWLARCGVRSFVLVGRHEPGRTASTVIAQLRSDGVDVVTATADVARAGEVERLLGGLPDGLAPITRVFHLAGVLSDCALVDLDRDQLNRVLAPKVRGAWNLHEATRGSPLDAFVLFSSAVSVLGSPGQVNYAAANAYLDALAHHRRAHGLPGLSINWGPWGEVGLVADRAGDRRAQFASAFDPDEAVELVGRFLAGGLDQVLALPYDLRNLLQHYPKVAGRDFFARVADDALLHGHRGVKRAYGRPDLAAPYVAARSELERLIQSVWERALSIEGIGVRDGFFELGGDSVVANQVAVQIERRFEIRIDREAIFDDMTVEGVAGLVEVELEKKLNELSDEDVDQLIAELDA
jgi:myxalamid-type polyketide synthase MxaC